MVIFYGVAALSFGVETKTANEYSLTNLLVSVPPIQSIIFGRPGNLYIHNGKPGDQFVFTEASVQSNSFFVREIGKTSVYGKSKTDLWAIESGLVYYSPLAQATPTKAPDMPRQRAESALMIVQEVLSFGIQFMKFGTFQWQAGGAFIAKTRNGREIRGMIKAVKDSLPATIEYTVDGCPATGFKTDYEYGLTNGFRNVPSRTIITGFIGNHPQFVTTNIIADITFGSFEATTNGFVPDYFKYERSPSGLGPVIYKNGEVYYYRNKQLIRMSRPSSGAMDRHHKWMLWVIFGALNIPFLFWFFARQKKEDNTGINI